MHIKSLINTIQAPAMRKLLPALLCCIFIFIGCDKKTNEKVVSDRLSLSGNDMQPMGGYVCKYLASKSFSNDTLYDNLLPFQKWHHSFLSDNYSWSKTVYFIVAPRLITYKNEALAMAEFVENGNTLFIAANYFDPFFLAQFSLSMQDDLSLVSTQAAFKMRDTKKQLSDSLLFDQSQYSFFFYPIQKSLYADSIKKHEVLGLNDFDSPDFLRVLHGKGQLIVMTNAQAFTNYFLLTKNNHNYALSSFSYLPTDVSNVYWDDFYRRNTTRSPEGKSLFSALLSIPALQHTFWIFIAIALLWIFTNAWRKQRIIPIQKPNINSSIEFTQTIARLYYNKKDNHNIALKMIAYLQDHVRNKYYMNYNGINDEFGEMLAAKTGLPPARMQSLVETIYEVQHNSNITDVTLLILNEQIQEVMKAERISR
ncbi:MAG: DUF4350 domain-containing protein [Bacteroidota bacterium]